MDECLQQIRLVRQIPEELIVSGTHICITEEVNRLIISISWILVAQDDPATNFHGIFDLFYYSTILQFSSALQMFILGPRLILGVREYHAKLVANSDAASAMTSISFQERIHISTSNGV
ncbi:hypothetical protein K503DRAFT_806487 [Rhizopogon vinicolor AM-OR11-026]|uniref:Uncharacterized protein n=1 Tax=Rhizopogon vinicolor AM-OR11-026 TaxID=1314800 RepID=A0A1B7MEF9_9AGAM|nr:hypothetical protein K503DRAFT_806487 [Rhizopogon vinicolor AM-OR11-026]